MAAQMPPQAPQQYPQMSYAQIAVTLLLIGAVILSIGVFALAFVPDEIAIQIPILLRIVFPWVLKSQVTRLG